MREWIRELLLADGATEKFADCVADLNTMSIEEDFMAAVTDGVQTVTRRPPTWFADYAAPPPRSGAGDRTQHRPTPS